MMQGVEIFIAIIPEIQFFYNWMSQEFMQSMVQDNLMDSCWSVVARIVNDPEARKRLGRHAPKKMSAELLMKQHGIDPQAFKDKLCMLLQCLLHIHVVVVQSSEYTSGSHYTVKNGSLL